MHIHVSALHALITLLEVIVALGTLRLLALANPDNRLAQAWLTLY